VSVASSRARLRWAAVAVGVAALVGVPHGVTAVLDARASSTARVPVDALVARARASASVPYTGRAESRGSLGLPDLPRLGDVAARLGGTTDARVWWAGPSSWRVAVLTATGEEGTYANGGLPAQWDFESSRLTVYTGETSVRLPRADDLLPPAVGRRFLGGVGPGDRITELPGVRRVAGQAALGLRLVPGDRRSAIGHADIWVRPADGLPLAFEAVAASGRTALDSRFTELSGTRPPAAALAPPDAPGIRTDLEEQPDVAARLEAFGRWRLPRTLAGLRSSAPVVGGSATYGPGLTKIVVLPVPPDLAAQLITAGQDAGGQDMELTGASSVLIRSGALAVGVVGSSSLAAGGWAVAGLVDPGLVEQAARQLVAHPPRQEWSE
jgi:hypothetical protein